MQNYFLAASILAFIVGIVHSLLGEILIFKKLRQGNIVPTAPAPPLQARNVRILWATWHLASVFGFAFAAILWFFAMRVASPDPVVINALIFAFSGGALLVLYATRGKHPGWIGLMLVAVLCYLGNTA